MDHIASQMYAIIGGPPMSNKVKLGSKVKVISNDFKYLEQYVGRTGKVVGSITDYSCVVELAGGLKRWFSLKEIELIKE